MFLKIISINKIIVIFSILNLSLNIAQEPNNIITFFINEYPFSELKNDKKKNEELRKICRIFDSNKNNCNGIEFPFNYGMFVLYAGYLTISDLNGQVSFPRKTQKPVINLLITNNIAPVFMLKNTIAFWEIKDPINTKMYKIEKLFDDAAQLHYWNVTEKPSPKNNRISIHTIIILADPNSIYVPLGITLIKNDSQLILPNIYAKLNYDHLRGAFFSLKVKPFFSSVKKIFKERPLGYQMQIIP